PQHGGIASLAYFTSSISLFFTDTATTEIYTLSLHDALPILPAIRSPGRPEEQHRHPSPQIGEMDVLAVQIRERERGRRLGRLVRDRKSTRLNSSHVAISYAVFCLKKKKNALVLEHLLQLK